MTVVLSGNQPAWMAAISEVLIDAERPVSVDHLFRVVPPKIGTARNDGHVTAARNGLSRDDYKAGWRIWIGEAVRVLRAAELLDGPDDAVEWRAPRDGTWKVQYGPSKVAIAGQAQRRQGRDRYALGNPDHPQTGLAAAGRVLRGEAAPFTVKVATHWRGQTNLNDVLVASHPLAVAIPPMTPAEQDRIHQDIADHGVQVPLLTYGKRTEDNRKVRLILDGRHRAWFASQTGQPVELVEFDGTEEQARDRVATLNLHRRQLTTQQRALAAVRLFGDEAKAEAAADQVRKPDSVRSRLSEQNNGRKPSGTAHERVWAKAGGDASGFSKAATKGMMTVAKAPETAGKVEAGEIRNTATAVRHAEAEIAGVPVPSPKAGTSVSDDDRTATRYIGQALYMLRQAARQYELTPGRATPAELDARLVEITRLAEQLRVAIRQPTQ